MVEDDLCANVVTGVAGGRRRYSTVRPSESELLGPEPYWSKP